MRRLMMQSMGITKRKSPIHSNDRFQQDATLPWSASTLTGSPKQEELIRRRTRSSSPNRWTSRSVIVAVLGVGVLIFLVLLCVSTNDRSLLRLNLGTSAVPPPHGSSSFPRVYRFHTHNASSVVDAVRSTFYHRVSGPKTSITPMISKQGQEWLEDSFEYLNRQSDEFETSTCKAMFPWQLQSFPTCNSIHEIDMVHGSLRGHDRRPYDPRLWLLTAGFWRDVWRLDHSTWQDERVVLKTLRYMHSVTQRNLDRNRRDALIMERLSQSPWILNVYSYCANTGLYEYASGGDIATAIWPPVTNTSSSSSNKYRRVNSLLTPLQKLEIGTVCLDSLEIGLVSWLRALSTTLFSLLCPCLTPVGP